MSRKPRLLRRRSRQKDDSEPAVPIGAPATEDAEARPPSGPAPSSGPRASGRPPSIPELEAVAAHARQRAALYRRKVLLGRGDPGRLAELERIADGAASRLRRAREERAG